MIRFRWRRRGARHYLLAAALALTVAASVGGAAVTLDALHYIYFDRHNLPDLGPFTRFEFPTIGHVYDVQGQPLIEMAREYRRITPYEDIPPIVRDAILAAEDKRFFSHRGVDYFSFPRILARVRVGPTNGRTMFPQGGSTITQQLVRGLFLQSQTALERGIAMPSRGLLPRILSLAIGPRNVSRLRRKADEIRLSLWLERQMQEQFGSRRRAKEAIFARYVSFVYMGNGQFGFARAADYYFDRPLSSLTTGDAGLAALLAGIMKAPRDYAPTAANRVRVLRRRNQILELMAAASFIGPDQLRYATLGAVPAAAGRAVLPFQSSAVIEHVLDELRAGGLDLGVEDLLEGNIQVYSTVDARVQRIVSSALEHGLERYEQRHPRARGLVQGSVVVLNNRDGSILAETGGRQVYGGRATQFSDYNRVRQSMRQPGSAMKPIVYLAAFSRGDFTLDTVVPDEPISVPDGRPDVRKWIRNYDGLFKGPIPMREALAESRNAVAIWITGQIGIDNVLRTARTLGMQTPLQRYATTALGASEISLLELATAYRTIASGLQAPPYLIRRIGRGSDDPAPDDARSPVPVPIDRNAIALIQEGLRGVVRIPTGTAHALDSSGFPIAVMGKTGTTSEFKDALFVGSTYGVDGITVAVRIGFDDGRSLGPGETGGRVAMPVFRELMLQVYHDGIVGKPPAFPALMEQRITLYLQRDDTTVPVTSPAAHP